MDYLDSIDCSLEDFQAMLYGKQFSPDSNTLEVCVSSDLPDHLLRDKSPCASLHCGLINSST